MKVLISVLSSLMLVFTLNSSAMAQTDGERIISELEAKIIHGFFVSLDKATQSSNEDLSIEDIVADVLKTVVNSTDESEEDDEASDKKKNKGKNKKKNKNKDKSNKGRGNGLPPGLEKQLAKNGTLPQGLQRKLEESGALPPGLQASALPPELEAHLTKLPKGQKRVVVDNDLLIIEEVTGQVLEAIPNIIPPKVADILKQLPGVLLSQ